jgi:molybdopterin-guanine dinucleotide biosynthesis protein B
VLVAQLWIQVVGSKKTGKTSLLESVTRELTSRGRSVCYVKHRHEEMRLDCSDTDTSRMTAAGAATSVLVGDESTAVFRRTDGESLDRVTTREALPGDIVLAEGWKMISGPKIVVAGGDLEIDALEGVVAVVGDAPAGFEGKVFAPDDVPALCDLMEDMVDKTSGDNWQTSLVIDGREIRLNAFVQDIFASTLLGMSKSLEGVEDADKIEIRCERKKG